MTVREKLEALVDLWEKPGPFSEREQALCDLFTESIRAIIASTEPSGAGGLLASNVLAWLKERGGESWKATIRDVEYAIENLRSSPLAVASSTETPLSDSAKGYLGRMADEKATRTPPQCTCGAKKGEWHKQECAVNNPPDKWFCDDCMMRDMTEAEGNAHHASTGHSVSSK